MPRNGSGTYTLPAGNPVEPGTVIESNWANATLEDIGDEITDSLSRTGEGGMLAPFRLFNGSAATPGLAFLNETSSGMYRGGAGEVWFSVLGIPVMQLTVNGVLVPAGKTLTAQGNATVGGTFGVTGNTTLSGTLGVTGATTVGGNLGVTGNTTLSGTLAVTGAITASGGVSGNATITGGSINNTPIGASTAAAGTFTNLTATGTATLGNAISATGKEAASIGTRLMAAAEHTLPY